MSNIFLIEEIQSDSMENSPDRASYYTIAGYVNTQSEAEEIVKKGGLAKDNERKNNWAVRANDTVFKYTPLSEYKEDKK